MLSMHFKSSKSIKGKQNLNKKIHKIPYSCVNKPLINKYTITNMLFFFGYYRIKI
jgi:hypothetical protein